MNELERYLFDLQGFLVVEDAVGPEQIAAINQLLDKQIAHIDEPGKPCFRFDSLLGWGSPLRALIDNPQITPYLVTLVGSRFRLDHDYVHQDTRSGKPPASSRGRNASMRF